MKTAIVTDFLNQFGGAEIVTHEIAKLFPSADIYTLFADQKVITKYFSNHTVFQHPKMEKSKWRRNNYRKLLPLYPTYIEDFDFRDYDLIISSSYLWAKGILCKPSSIHISYIHTPIRQAWVKYHEYLEDENDVGRFSKTILRFIMNYIRIWDVCSSERVDYYIANSSVVQERIKKIYGKPADIIHPPIEVQSIQSNLATSKDDYYITIGRLVPYKKVDIMIQAFNKMPEKKLLILGTGNDENRLSNLIQSPNVKLMGYVSETKKIELLSKAKGFLFCAEEDFGMSPVEALAAGIPLIGYEQGGTVDYLINELNGISFSKQTPDSLISAIDKFEKFNFKHEEISKSVTKFDSSIFRTKFSDFINDKIGQKVC